MTDKRLKLYATDNLMWTLKKVLKMLTKAQKVRHLRQCI